MNHSLLRSLRLPVLSVFENHIEEWVDVVSDWIAQLVAKELRLDFENIESLSEKIDERIKELVDNESGRIFDKFTLKTYAVIVEGDLTLGKKNCEVGFFLSLFNAIYRKLYLTSREKVYNGEWEIMEEEEKGPTNKNWWEVDDEDEDDDEGSFKTPFEETLRNYIPSVLENDVKDFILALSQIVAMAIKENDVSEEEIPFFIKEEISDDISEIVEILEELGSKYINVIKGDFTTGIKPCRIMRVDEFVDKLYQHTFKQTLNFLDENSKIFSKDYFDDDF
jgi:hypothetical protein